MISSVEGICYCRFLFVAAFSLILSIMSIVENPRFIVNFSARGKGNPDFMSKRNVV